jgi:predicted DNA-binding ribbon-helix-helix protein
VTNASLRKFVIKTAVIKRSILINGKKTSVSLENEFWDALHEIAKYKNTTAARLAGEISRQCSTVNLSSAIRVYVYKHFRSLEGRQKTFCGPTRRHLDKASLRGRAEECRTLADRSNDKDMRAVMLRIAADYEQMAANAARPEGEAESD